MPGSLLLRGHKDYRQASPPGSSVHGISQVIIQGKVAISFSMGVFPTQGSNPSLLRYRQILCHWITRGALSVQFSHSVVSSSLQSHDCSTPGLPVHHQLPEFTQTHVHWVSDVIQPSHSLSSPSPIFNLSQHQGLFQWVSSSHQVAKVFAFQLQPVLPMNIWDWSPLGWTG